MGLLIFTYNFLMLVGLTLLLPIWLPLMAHREKHRSTFLKRLFMESIDGDENGATVDGGTGRIWIHALSVGEVLSAEPLVETLQKRYGAERLVFSASTQTGFEMATRVIAPHVSTIRHFPYDSLFSVNRSLAVIQPRQVLIVETDIWPNFLYRLHKCRIPVHLVNARLSDRSFSGYQRLGFLMAPLLSIFGRICVQSALDRSRFRELGVADETLVTVGNIKFDQSPLNISRDELEQLEKTFSLRNDAPIWVAGSTHEGEEEIVCNALRRLSGSGIDVVTIVVPRDPQRAEAVCRIFRRSGIDTVTMKQAETERRTAKVVVIDRIGILRTLYALADVAFVGGSLVKAGGHNPLEPASVAAPVLFGPHTDDFRLICHTLEKSGGAIRVSNADGLAEKIGELIVDANKRMAVGKRAQAIFRNNQGAVERTMAVVLDAENRLP